MLVSADTYLASGIHIGTRQKIKQMQKYIYKIREDKLSVFDVQKINQRIKLAAQFLSNYKAKDILVVSRKKIGHKPIVKFAELTGAKAVYGRFMPGMLTNPNYKEYLEPKVLIVTDPFADKQAVKEGYNANIPVIGICDTYNDPKYLDLVIPMNNKGRKAIALLYWILAREFLKEKKKIKGNKDFKVKIEDFEMPVEKMEPKKEDLEPRRGWRRGRKKR